MIRLRTLGAVELFGLDDEELATVLAQPKRFAVLFYLAMAGSSFQRRDTLFGLFWPETDQQHARAALNQALYFLRRELGHDFVLSRGNEEVTVDADLVWCDALAFQAALDEGDRREALELYRGELLPGFFLSDTPAWERWLDGERDRLRGRAATAAWEAAEQALARKELAEAARRARQAVEIVPYDEVQLRRLLGLLAGIGDRTGAAKAFEEAAARFAADYDGELSEATRSLAERIQAGDLDEVHVDAAPSAGSGLPGPVPSAPAAAAPPAESAKAAVSNGTVATAPPLARPASGGGRRLLIAAALLGVVLFSVAVLSWMEVGAMPGGGSAADAAKSTAAEAAEVVERERLRDPGTTVSAARREYLTGRYLLGKSDEASFRAALGRFRAALDLDPAYADAWSGLSNAYDHLAGIGAMPSAEAYPRARAAAERALEIDPDHAEAHSSLAMALSHHYWQSDDAERHWRRAIELNPSDARARRTYAGHLRNLGRFEEALAHATIARDLDPIPFFSHFELLVIPYFQGRYEHVVESAGRLAASDPAYGYAHFLRALALVQLERYDEALAALDAADPAGEWTDARLIRAYVASRTGNVSEARRELEALEADPNPASRGFERAILHIGLDEPDRAMASLEEAYGARAFRLRLIGHEPLFDPLRDDPRFRDLLERIGLGEVESASDS